MTTPPVCPHCICTPADCEADDTGQHCMDVNCGTCLHGCPDDNCPVCLPVDALIGALIASANGSMSPLSRWPHAPH